MIFDILAAITLGALAVLAPYHLSLSPFVLARLAGANRKRSALSAHAHPVKAV